VAVISYGTATVDKTRFADSYLKSEVSASNFGTEPRIKLNGGGNIRHSVITLKMPDAPEDAAITRPNKGITAVSLRLYHETGPAAARTWTVFPMWRAFEEDVVNYNNFGPIGTSLGTYAAGVGDTGGHVDPITITNINTQLGISWGDELPILIQTDYNGVEDEFHSREGTTANIPVLRITYEVKELTPITDLKVEVDPTDATKKNRLLTWTPSQDSDFLQYEVWRSDGGGAYAKVSSDITQQGTNAFLDISSITEGVLAEYDVRIKRSSAATIVSSNIVWMIRPTSSTAVAPATPQIVGTKVTLTVTGALGAATPSPTSISKHIYDWGDGSGEIEVIATGLVGIRTHGYAATGALTLVTFVENSLGFRGNADNTAYTINSTAPVGKIKSSPLDPEVNATITLYAEESYCPASNKELAAANAYEWDLDNNGTWEVITTVPETTTSFGSAGAKTVNLRVKDQDGTYSAIVSIVINVKTKVLVNLDTLVNKFQVLKTEVSLMVNVHQGLETYAVDVGGKKAQGVEIGGKAIKDTDADNIPDDIETLLDIVANKKPVQLTVHNVVRTGRLIGAPTMTKGGWNYVYDWSATIALDP
jgi:hypothetical protein